MAKSVLQGRSNEWTPNHKDTGFLKNQIKEILIISKVLAILGVTWYIKY